MPFAIIDVVLFVIFLIICIRAAINGLIDEVFGLGTFIIGAYLAFMFMNKLQPFLAKSMNDTIASILSFLILFIIVFLVMKIIQLVLKSVFSGSILNSLDHGLGFIFGAAEGIVVIVLIFMILIFMQKWIDTKSLLESSWLYKNLSGMVNTASSQFLENI